MPKKLFDRGGGWNCAPSRGVGRPKRRQRELVVRKRRSARVAARLEEAEAEVKRTTEAGLSGGGATAPRRYIGKGRRIIPISPRVEPTSGLRELEVSVIDWRQGSERKAEKNLLALLISDNWKNWGGHFSP